MTIRLSRHAPKHAVHSPSTDQWLTKWLARASDAEIEPPHERSRWHSQKTLRLQRFPKLGRYAPDEDLFSVRAPLMRRIDELTTPLDAMKPHVLEAADTIRMNIGPFWLSRYHRK